jgi:hypothetical protein
MAILTREEILASNDAELKELEVKEWGGSVYMSKLSLADQFKYDELFDTREDGTFVLKNPHNPSNVLEYLRLVLKDAVGKPLFDIDDMRELSNKSSEVLMKVFKSCSSYNSRETEIEDIKKKSEQTLGDSSSIG